VDAHRSSAELKTAPCPGWLRAWEPRGWIWGLALVYPLLLASRLNFSGFLVTLMTGASCCPAGAAEQPGSPLDAGAWGKAARDD